MSPGSTGPAHPPFPTEVSCTKRENERMGVIFYTHTNQKKGGEKEKSRTGWLAVGLLTDAEEQREIRTRTGVHVPDTQA